jgi:hypothetical protein
MIYQFILLCTYIIFSIKKSHGSKKNILIMFTPIFFMLEISLKSTN